MFMKVRISNTRLLVFVALCAICLGSVSCKKKEETSKKYMKGTVSFVDMDYITFSGIITTVHVKGVEHPDGKKLKCSYTFNGKTLDIPEEYTGELEFRIVIPEEVGRKTLTVTIAPEDTDNYYSSSASFTYTIIDYEKSLPELSFDEKKDFLMGDDRDGSIYICREIGGVAWMRENLAYGDEDFGMPYRSEKLAPLFGRLYTYEEASVACPEGWTLPSDQDYINMVNALVPGDYSQFSDIDKVAGSLVMNITFNGDKMWEYSPAYEITKDPQFCALPMGYGIKETGYLDGYSRYAAFWTSDVNPLDAGQAMYRYLYLDSDKFMSGTADKNSMTMTVRCIKK